MGCWASLSKPDDIVESGSAGHLRTPPRDGAGVEITVGDGSIASGPRIGLMRLGSSTDVSLPHQNDLLISSHGGDWPVIPAGPKRPFIIG